MALEIASVRDSFAKNENRTIKALVAGPPGSGKAQPHDCKILTPRGWTTMGDIAIGDYVCTPDGGIAKVENKYGQGQIPVYEVTFSDGSRTRCSDEHLWLVQSKDDRHKQKARVETLEQIREKMFRGDSMERNRWIPVVEAVAFESGELPLDPYVLGAYLGDGYSRKNEISISKDDPCLAENIASRIGEERVVEQRKPDRCRAWKILGVEQILVDLGLFGLGSKEKFIPKAYLLAGEKERLDLLAGLIDTDGYAQGHTLEYSTSSTHLADDFAFLCWSLGFTFSRALKLPTYTYEGERKSGAPSHRFYLCPPQGLNPFLLPRKQAAFTPRSKYRPRRAFVSAVPDGIAECSCIQLGSAAQLYITDDFVVTHNTRSASCWPNPVIADIEGRLLSIRDRDILSVRIRTIQDLIELKAMLAQDEGVRRRLFGRPIDTVVLDTVDEIARLVVKERMKAEKIEQMRIQDWGYLGDTLRNMLRAYRNLDINVVFNVHVKSTEDSETGRVEYKPDIQGAVAHEIAGYVDESFLLVARMVTDQTTGDRAVERHFQCAPDGQHNWLKDHSGAMPLEFPVDFNTDYERMAKLIFGAPAITSPQAEVEIISSKDLAEEIDVDLDALKVPARKIKPVKKAVPVSKPEPESPAPEPEPEPEPVVVEPEPEPVAAVTVPEVGTEIVDDDPLADLGNETEDTGPVCSECGVAVTEDYSEYTQVRFGAILCRAHLSARQKRK